ncbi:MAG: glycosyltransferase family 2 protein [Methanobacterium sp.]
MNPKVSIVILNWNGWNDTIECLESVYQIDYPNYDIIIVDNGSKDNSIKKIKDYCQGRIEVKSDLIKYDKNNKPFKILEYTEDELENYQINNELNDLSLEIYLIKNDKNYFFAGGNNIGIKFALKALNADFVLLLNNDTVVDEKFLSELISVYNKCPNAGILSPFVYFYDKPTKIQLGGQKVRNIIPKSEKLWIKYKDKSIIQSETAAGPSMLISKQVLNKVGLLPKECDFLLTDIYYSFSTKKKGFEILSVRNSKIWHKSSVSIKKVKYETIKSQTKESIIFKYKFMSKVKFMQWMLINIIFFYPYICLKSIIFNKNLKGTKSLYKGFNQGIKHIMNQ